MIALLVARKELAPPKENLPALLASKVSLSPIPVALLPSLLLFVNPELSWPPSMVALYATVWTTFFHH